MSKSKWGIIGIVTVTIAILLGGLALFFSVTSAISLKKYCELPRKIDLEERVFSEGSSY